MTSSRRAGGLVTVQRLYVDAYADAVASGRTPFTWPTHPTSHRKHRRPPKRQRVEFGAYPSPPPVDPWWRPGGLRRYLAPFRRVVA